MLKFETAALNEVCQLCERPVEDEQVRLRRVYEVIVILCQDCMKDNNKWKVVEANRREDFFGKAQVDTEPVEAEGEDGS